MTIFSGGLRYTIDIKQKTVTRAPNGEEVITWTTFAANVPADVTPIRGREYVALRAGQSEVSLRIRIRYLAGINQTMRIVWESNDYDIESVIPFRHQGEIELMCFGSAEDA